jgi:CO/xanthine dehydrogenase FAD-binding subunit
MIPYDLTYLRPSNAAEAARLYEQSRAEGLETAYYAGGTEILSFIRQRRMKPEVLIDIKEISECRNSGREDGHVVLGAALSLNEVIESGLFPLLSAACGRIADHTVRNRLTLGGNLCGRLPYREAVLPLLVAEAEVELSGPAGSRWEPLTALLDKRLKLQPGQLLLRIRVGLEATRSSAFHGRRQRGTRVDYPLVTCCLLEVDGESRLAITGACGYPLRDSEAEESLSDPSLDRRQKIKRAVAQYAPRVRGDFRASREYRIFLIERILAEGLDELTGEGGG